LDLDTPEAAKGGLMVSAAAPRLVQARVKFTFRKKDELKGKRGSLCSCPSRRMDVLQIRISAEVKTARVCDCHAAMPNSRLMNPTWPTDGAALD
jgi:hypothetical protein